MRPLAPVRSRSVALCLAVALVSLSACGEDESGGSAAPTSLEEVEDADDLAAYLATLPGVEEVEAGKLEADTDFYLLNVDVGVSDDATVEQIVDVVAAVEEHGADPQYDETPELSVHEADNPDHRLSVWLYRGTDAAPLAEAFLTAAASPTLDDVGWHVGSEAEVQVDEVDLPDVAAVTTLAEEIAADTALAEIEGWLLPSDQNAVPRAYLGTRIGFTEEVLAAWAAVSTEPGDEVTLAAATLTPRLSFGEYLQNSPTLDSFEARVALDLGDDVAPASVTEAEYGDLLVPLIEAQVTALGNLPSDVDQYELNQRRNGNDTLLADLPLPGNRQYRPGKDIDPAWQAAAERAAG